MWSAIEDGHSLWRWGFSRGWKICSSSMKPESQLKRKSHVTQVAAICYMLLVSRGVASPISASFNNISQSQAHAANHPPIYGTETSTLAQNLLLPFFSMAQVESHGSPRVFNWAVLSFLCSHVVRRGLCFQQVQA
jgi:hypothetical protein